MNKPRTAAQSAASRSNLEKARGARKFIKTKKVVVPKIKKSSIKSRFDAGTTLRSFSKTKASKSAGRQKVRTSL